MNTSLPPTARQTRLIRFSPAKFAIAAFLCFAMLITGPISLYGATLYWDTNGTGTAGSGAATGTWGTSVFWSADSTGANIGSPVLTASTGNTDNLFIAAGTNGTTGTITVSATQAANSITFDDPVAVTISGGTAITLGGGGGTGTGIFQAANGANVISTGITLGASTSAFAFSNSSTSLLTIGAVTGAATSGTQTITVGSSNTGGITLNGIIGNGVGGGNVGLIINNTGAGFTTLSAANTFTGGTQIQAGTLKVGNATALGANASTVSMTSGAVLDVNGIAMTGTNALTINGTGTGSGALIDGISTAATYAGGITLGSASTIGNLGTNTFTLSGAIGGSGNLTFNAANTGAFTVSPSSVNNTGTITNNGAGAGTTTIATVGAAGAGAVTGVTENSTTSALTVTTLNVANAGTTTLTNALGTKLLTVTNSVAGTGNLVISNNSATAQGITFTAGANNIGTVTNNGTGAGAETIPTIGVNVTGVLQNSSTSALTLTGLTVNGTLTTLTSGGTSLFTVTNQATGLGALTINANSTGNITLTAGANNAGGITNSGNNTNLVTIGAIGATNTGGVIQNAANSILFLNGAGLYTGGTQIQAGTLKVGNATALGANTSTVSVTSGAVLDVNGIAMTGTNALTLNGTGTGSGALIDGISTAATYAGGISLGSASTIGNLGTTTFTLSGAIAGTGNLTFNATNTGAFTVSGTSVNNTGTITNSGAGAGALTISGPLQTNVTGLIQNSATSQTTLTGTNTFTTNIQVIKGTLTSSSNTTPFGSGAGSILLGDTTASNTNAATLSYSGTATTISNPITVNAGSSGALSILGLTNTNTFTGAITLNNNLTVDNNTSAKTTTFSTGTMTQGGSGALTITKGSGAGAVTFSGALVLASGGLTFTNTSAALLTESGAVSGTGSLTFNANSSGGITLGAGAVNNSGTITNSGTSSGITIITGAIGANVSSVTQNSTSSQLTLQNIANTYNGPTNVNQGQVNTGALATGTITPFGTGASAALKIGSATTTTGATVNVNTALTNTIAIPIFTVANNLGVSGGGTYLLQASTGADTFSGAITLAHDIEFRNTNGTASTMTFSGSSITGTGSIVTNGTSTGSAITLSATSINNTGTITNIGAGNQTTTISGILGSSVGAVIQNSTTSPLTISGANTTWTGGLQILAGTVNAITSGSALGTGTVLLGNISGSATATLSSNSGAPTFANNITVQSGSVGIKTISNTAANAVAFTGGTITLNDALTLSNTSTSSLTIGDIIQGNFDVAITGSSTGLFSLAGANTYSGNTSISSTSTTLAVASVSSVGSVGALTSGAFGTGILNLNAGAQLRATTGGNITLGNAVNINADTTFATVAAEKNLTFTGPVTLVGGTRTLTSLVGSTVAGTTVTFQGVISDGGSSYGLTKAGAGNITMSAANTYTGATTLSGGTLITNLLADGGTASGIGQSSSASTNLILSSGTLQYTGAAQSTNRLFDLTGSSTLDASGTGALNFTGTGAITYAGAASARTLTLTGSSTLENVFSPALADSGTGANITSLTKTGAGTWVLNGTNTYSGATTVSAGVLDFARTSAKSSGTTVTGAANTFIALGVGGAGYYSSSDLDSLFANTVSGFNRNGSGVGVDTTNNGGTFTYGTNVTTTSGLAKLGTGTWALTGTVANTQAVTFVSAGTLDLSGATLSGGTYTSPSLTINAGASLLLPTSTTLTAGTGVTGTATTVTSLSGTLTGGMNFLYSGTGTQTFLGANSYTGTTAVNSGLGGLGTGATTAGIGTILLDFSALGAPTTNILYNGVTANTLQLGSTATTLVGGGTLSQKGTSGATNSQTFSGLIVSGGANSILQTQNSATSVTLALGPITRSVGGTLDFTTTPSASGVIATTSSGSANAILTDGNGTAYATVGGFSSWAAKDASGNIIDLTNATTGYTPSGTTTYSGNADITGAVTGASGATVNSIRVSTASTLTLAGANTVSTGGILFTAAGTISGGSIAPGTGNELVILGKAGGTLGSVIGDGSGGGAFGVTYRLAPGISIAVNTANTYTGNTYLTSGRLSTSLGAAGSPFGTGNVYINGNTNATFFATGAATFANNFFITGNGFAEASGPFGAIRLQAGTISGTVTLLGNSTISATGGNGTISGQITSANSGNYNLAVFGNSGTQFLTLNNTTNNWGGTTLVTTAGLDTVKGALSGWNTAGKVSVAGTGILAFMVGGPSGYSVADLDSVRGTASVAGTVSFGATSFLGIDTTNATSGFTYSSNITNTTVGNLGLAKVGSNTLTLSGANTYTGGTWLLGGVLALNAQMTSSSTGTINLGNATLANYSGSSITHGNALSPGAINGATTIFSGTSALIFTGVTTAANNNTITSNNSAGLTLGAYNNNGKTVTFNGSGPLTFSGVLSNSGTINYSGTSTVTLAGANTFTGTTAVNGGSVLVTNPAGLGGSGATLTLNNGVLDLRTDSTILNAYATTLTGTTAILLTDKASPSSGGIIHTLGGLTLNTASTVLTVAPGSNVSGGSPAIAFGATSMAVTTGGTYTLNPISGAALTLTTVGSTLTTSGTNTLVLSGSSSGNAVTGAISNSTGTGTPVTNITKSGSSTWTLSGVNTFSGPLTLQGGTLALDFTGTGTTVGGAATTTLSIGGNSTLNFLGKTSASAQTWASLTTTAGGGTINFGNANGGVITITSATLTTAAGNSLNINYNQTGGTNGATIGNNQVVFTTAPAIPSGILVGSTANTAFTVTDVGGSGFATVNGSKQVIRLTGQTALPRSTGSSTTNYVVNSNSAATVAGSLIESLTATVAANTVTIDTANLTSGAQLDLGNSTFQLQVATGLLLTGANPYSIVNPGTGGLKGSGTNTDFTIDNFGTGGLSISAPILVNGTGGIVFNGTGTTTLNNSSTTTGAAILNGGTVKLGNATALGTTAITLTLTGGTLDLNGINPTVTTISGLLGSVITDNSGGSTISTLTVSNHGAVTLASTVKDGATQKVALSLTGAGAIATDLNITGPNTFTGGTTIGQGRVLLNQTTTPNATLGTGTITIGSTATSTATLLYTASTVTALANNLTIAGVGVTETGGPFGALRVSGPLQSVATQTGTITLAANATLGSQGGTGIFGGKITGGSSPTFYGGTIVLTNTTSDYTGDTVIGAGNAIAQINATTLRMGAANVIPNGTGKGNVTFGQSGTNAATATWNLNGFSQIINGLSGTTATITPVIDAGAGTATLTVGNSDATANYAGLLQNTGGSVLTLIKMGTGTETLSGLNTFSGSTTVQNGTLSVTTLNSVATDATLGTTHSTTGSLGAPLTVAQGTIGLGSTTVTGGLTVTGTGETTDRVIDLAGTTGGATLTQNGTGVLKFTSAFTVSGAGTKTLTLSGSTAGVGEIAQGITNNSVSNITSLTKSGTGQWTLDGNNTYTGATSITGGTLVLDHSGTNVGQLASDVSVSGGATFLVKGSTSIGASTGLTLAGGASAGTKGTFSMADTLISTLTVAGGLSFGTGANGSILSFDLGSINGSSDFINASGTATVNGTTSINLAALTLASGSTSYTLMTAAGGGFTAGGSGFTVGTKPAGFNSFSLANSTVNSIILDVTANAAIVGNAYWTGIASADSGSPDALNQWGYGALLSTIKSNWSTDAAGLTDPLQTPSSTSDVIFTASNVSSSTVATTLDTSYSIKSLTFNTASPITAASITTTGNTLTIGSGGITIASTNSSSASIIGTGSILTNVSQTWSNASSADFTVSSGIAGTATTGQTQTITINNTGTGKIILGGALTNGSAGGTLAVSVTGGTLALTTGGSLSSSTPLTVNGSTAVFDLGANLSTSAGSVTLDGSGVINGSGTSTLTVNSTNTVALKSGTVNAILAGTGALNKTTTNTVTLNGANTFSGVLTVSAGTLKIGNASALGSAATTGVISSGGTLDLNGISYAAAAKPLTFSGTIINSSSSAASYGLTSGIITNANGTVNVASGTITLGQVNSSTLTKTGNGTLIMADGSGDNNGLVILVSAGEVDLAKTTSGRHVIGAGLTINGSGALVKVTGTATSATGNQIFNGTSLTVTNGTFDLNGQSENVNGFAGASAGLVTNNAASTISTLTVGGVAGTGTGTGTYAGLITNGASGTGIVTLAKNGTAVITLTGSNTYTGVTTINGGGLSVTTMADIGSASGIGKGDGTTDTTNASSLVLNGGTLSYTGAAQSTNRLFNLLASSSLDSSGSGALNFTNTGTNLANGTASARTLTLTGTNTGLNTLASVLADSGTVANITSLTKTGAGKWVLTANNTFSGGVSINVGDLVITNSNALGAGTKTITIIPTTNPTSLPALRLDPGSSGSITLPSTLSFTTSFDALNAGVVIANAGAVINDSGNNTIQGNFSLTSGGGGTTFLSNAGKLTISGNITAGTTTRALYLRGNGNGEISGIISNGATAAMPLTMDSGTGTWTLSGTNTYTGGTNINAGVLALGSGLQALGGSGTIASVGTIAFGGGILQYSAANQVDYSSRFSSAAGQAFNIDTNGQNVTYASQIISTANNSTLTKIGAGTLTLSSAVSHYTGATTITGGILSVGTLANGGADSSIGTSTNVASNLVLNGGTLKYTGGAQSTDRLFDLKASSGIDASGSGALVFTGNGAITTSGTASARTLTLSGTNTGDNTLTPVLANSGTGANITSLVKSGAGTWVLAALNTYTGTTTVSGGTLKAGTTQSLGVNSAVTLANSVGTAINLNNFNNTIGSLAGGGSTGGNVLLGGATLTTGGDGTSTSYAGVISGTGGSLVKNGAGTQILSGVNTYTGTTTISSGALQTDIAGALPTGTAVTLANVAGVALNLNNNSQTIASLAGAGSTGGAVTLGTAVLTTGDTNNTIYNGSISGSGASGLIKQGSGVFTLDTNSSLTGTMAVSLNAGSMVINGTGGSNVSISISGSTTLSGLGTLSGQVTVNNSGTITAGQSGIGSLTLGNLIFGGTAGDLATANLFNVGSGASASLLNVANLTANGGANTITLNATSSGLGNTSYSLINYTGTLSGFSAFHIGTVTGLNGRQTPSLADSGTAIMLVISGDSPQWTGYDALSSAPDAVWHIPAPGAAQNWQLVTGTTPTDYQAGDAVLFNDMANTGRTTVSINEGDVSPASVTITNPSKDYVFGGTFAITGATSIVKNGAGTATFNNSNSFTGGLTVNAGSVILNASNTFTGGLTINNGGIITLGAASAIGTSNAVVFGAGSTGQFQLNGNNATVTGLSTNATSGTPMVQNTNGSTASVLTVNIASGTNTFAGVLQDGGSATLGITKSGNGTLILTGANTQTGADTVTGGTLQIGSGGTSGSLIGNTAISSGAFVVFNRSDSSTYAGSTSGLGTLTAQGGSTLVITGTLAHTGGTTIVSGETLQVGNGGATGAFSGTGSITDNGTLTINRSGSTTIDAAIGGIGNLSTTSGTLIVTGSNSYSGATVIGSGSTLQMGNGSSTGTLGTATSITDNGTFTINRTGPLTYSTNIGGSGAFNAMMASGTLTLSGTNTYSNGTTVSMGTLLLGTSTAFPTATGLTVGSTGNSATFDLNNFNTTVNTLATAGTAANQTITNSATGTAILTYNSASSSTFGGSIADTSSTKKIGVTITGGGTLQLTKTNAYTGGTIVTNGTAQLGADNAFSTTSLVLGGTSTIGTLDLNGFNQSFSSYSVGSGGVAANQTIGNSSTTADGTFTFTGTNNTFASILKDAIGSGTRKTALTLSGNGTFTLTGANTYSGLTTVGSTATLQIGNGGTVGTLGGGAVTVTGAVVFNRTNAYTLSSGNLVTGAGSVTLANSGSVVAAVDNQFNTTGALNFGTSVSSTTASSLDLSAGSSTFGSLNVITNTTSTNTIALGSKTLTINGSVNVGNTTASAGLNTNLAITGASGALLVNLGTSGTLKTGNFTGGVGFYGSSNVNLSALGTFTVTGGASSAFTVAAAGDNGSSGVVVLRLASVANAIQAATVSVGAGGTSANQSLLLGNGTGTTNIINTDTLNLGTGGRDGGILQFDTGSGSANGSVTISNRAGNGGATVLNIGTGTAATASNNTNIFDVTGHQANLNFGAVTMTSQVRIGTLTTNFLFDKGSLTILNLTASVKSAAAGAETTNITLGSVNSINGTDTATITNGILQFGQTTGTGASETVTANLNIAGGTVNIGATSGTSINMASAVASSTANASVTITGGVTTLSGNIVKGGGAGTTSATVTLNGASAVLDMSAKNIGDATNVITFNAQSGTLKNLGELNGGGAFIKSAGTNGNTLILEGNNTYSGTTTISAGTLQIGSGGTTGTLGSNAGTINNTGTLAINRSNAVSIANVISGTGGVSQIGSGTTTLSGANAYTGTTTVSAGTLQVGTNSTTTATSGTGDVAVTGGSLTGTGTISASGKNTTISGLASLMPGDASAAAGTARNAVLNIGGNLVTSAGGTTGGEIQLKITSATVTDSSFASYYTANGGTKSALDYYNSLTSGDQTTLMSSWNAAPSGAAGSRGYDYLNIAGSVTLTAATGGRAMIGITTNNYNTQSIGDVFNLLDWNTVGTKDASGSMNTGGFTVSNDLALPTLNAGLSFDTSLFVSNGIVVVVPEPSRVLLLFLGLAALFMRRRRK